MRTVTADLGDVAGATTSSTPISLSIDCFSLFLLPPGLWTENEAMEQGNEPDIRQMT